MLRNISRPFSAVFILILVFSLTLQPAFVYAQGGSATESPLPALSNSVNSPTFLEPTPTPTFPGVESLAGQQDDQPGQKIALSTIHAVDRSNFDEALELSFADAIVQLPDEIYGQVGAGGVRKVKAVRFDKGGRVLIDLSQAAVPGDEETSNLLFQYFHTLVTAALDEQGVVPDVLEFTILVDGRPIDGPETLENPSPSVVSSIQDVKIAINDGHGYVCARDANDKIQNCFLTGTSRSLNGLRQQEDEINHLLAQKLNNALIDSGVTTIPLRDINNNNSFGFGNYKWYQMGSREYAKRILPDKKAIWDYTGQTGKAEEILKYKDYNTRPYLAINQGANILVSLHNNSGIIPNFGTLIIYDTSNSFAEKSRNLALAIQNRLQRLNPWYFWPKVAVEGRPTLTQSSYGENRLFFGPAVLIELANMDVPYELQRLVDSEFQKYAMLAVKDGLIDYTNGTKCEPPSNSAWKGEYFQYAQQILPPTISNMGKPVLCRNDPSINFFWGTSPPKASMWPDQFAARWTRTMYLDAGVYRFHLAGDDGVRLWVDNQLLIDQWKGQGYTEYPRDWYVNAGLHNIRIEYYENGGGAAVSFWQEKIAACPAISGWKGEYWNNSYLSGLPVMCRDDRYVTFNWSTLAPGGPVSADNFSARWTRQYSLPAGVYRFHLMGDDGIRFKLDGNTIINQWKDQGYTEYTADIQVGAGTHTLTIEYYENGGSAAVNFWWDYFPYEQLSSRYTGKCMDLLGFDVSNGAPIGQWDCNGYNNQAWSFVPMGSGYYKLVSKYSGKCLDVSGWSTYNGARLQQWDCHNGTNQQFLVQPWSWGSYRLVNRNSGKCLDVTDWAKWNGARLQQWECHNGDNQLWYRASRANFAGSPSLDGSIELDSPVENGSHLGPSQSSSTLTTRIDYTVREGETLDMIASLYEISVGDILTANSELHAAEDVLPGQTLSVPIHAPTYTNISPEGKSTYTQYLPNVMSK